MDARLSERVVTDPLVDGLSDGAFRVWCMALAWSAGQDADGRIPRRVLRLLHPGGAGEDAAVELVTAGVWRESREGFVNLHGQNWQTTATDALRLREASAERSRKYRERKREASRGDPAGVTSAVTEASRSSDAVEASGQPATAAETGSAVTGDVTRDASRDGVGEARPGEEGEGYGEGKGTPAVILAAHPNAAEARELPAAWQAAARNGWSADEFAAALRRDLSASAGPGAITNAARALSSKPSPSETRRAETNREKTRKAAPDCEHGTPNGTYRRPGGTLLCAFCRSVPSADLTDTR